MALISPKVRLSFFKAVKGFSYKDLRIDQGPIVPRQQQAPQSPPLQPAPLLIPNYSDEQLLGLI